MGEWKRLCVSFQVIRLTFLPLMQRLPLSLNPKGIDFNLYSIHFVVSGNSLKILVVVVCGSIVLLLNCFLSSFALIGVLVSMRERSCGGATSQISLVHFNLQV